MSDRLNKEILKIKRTIEKESSRKIQPLIKAYQSSLKRIQGEMTQLTSRYVEDGLLKFSDAQRYSILRSLEKQIIEQAREIGQLELASTTDILKDAYSTSYYKTAYQLERGMILNTSFALLHPHMVERAVNMPLKGEMFSDRIWKNKEGMINRLRGTLARNMIEGKDPSKLARELSRAYGTSAYESSRLVQNEVARCTRQANDLVFEESGVVEQVMFDATLDDSTTEICEELDGKTFDLGTQPSIPDDTHVGCRSDYIPVVEGWSPTRKVDNESKEVIDYTTYSKWAKSRGIT